MLDGNSRGSPLTLLLHDGELGDVRELLSELGTGFIERRGALLAEDRSRTFDLAIATPQRMLGLEFDASHRKPTQIAICDSDTRSLRNSLRRAGIQLMVRRPVHPAALRAIVLHSLYRGPERRRSVRVSIGAPVRFRSGWRQRPAVLADLSVGGFRLLTRDHVAPGRSIKLTIPAEVSGDRPLAVRARVLRATPDADGSHTVTAKLDTLRPKQLDALKGVLKAHASGPARFDASQLPAAPDPTPTTAGDGRDGALRLATGGSRAGAPEAAAGSPDANDAERRSGPRRVIDRRVIALGEEATRVLIGRDISVGGMRVNPNPVLSVGDDVRLAIHLGNQELPLVVTARVHRDDGERGLILRFHALDPEGTVQLNAMLESLPILDPSGGDGNGMIVSEILANGR